MKQAFLIGGIVLIILGILVVTGVATYRTDKSVFQVGEFKATAEEHKGVPVGVGAAALAGGVVLIVFGALPRGGRT